MSAGIIMLNGQQTECNGQVSALDSRKIIRYRNNGSAQLLTVRNEGAWRMPWPSGLMNDYTWFPACLLTLLQHLYLPSMSHEAGSAHECNNNVILLQLAL